MRNPISELSKVIDDFHSTPGQEFVAVLLMIIFWFVMIGGTIYLLGVCSWSGLATIPVALLFMYRYATGGIRGRR